MQPASDGRCAAAGDPIPMPQVIKETFPALEELGACAGGCWLWPSITQRSYETAELLSSLLGLGRNRIIPEYSFLDARRALTLPCPSGARARADRRWTNSMCASSTQRCRALGDRSRPTAFHRAAALSTLALSTLTQMLWLLSKQPVVAASRAKLQRAAERRPRACEGPPVAGRLTRGRFSRGMGALEGLPLAEAGSAVLAGDSASPGPPLLRGLPRAGSR
jgi:hypothetical protein